MRRRVRAERRPDLEPGGHQGRRVVAAVVRLRPGRRAAVLDQMVFRRPGVLQVRAEGVAAHQSLPVVRVHVGRRKYAGSCEYER